MKYTKSTTTHKFFYMKSVFTLSILFLFFCSYGQKFEGLALTPPMGWNSWNTFEGKISEQVIMEMADAMVSTGMKNAGYIYLVIDDEWMAKERDPKSGDLVPDPIKFPRGMKYLSDYVHSKGLKFGLYNCAGTLTCAGYPGTRGYEYQDARYYAAVGIDYLKFDWCNTQGINAKEAYSTMSKALKKAGRPIVFSLCEWGSNKPWLWAAPIGHLWRTTGDINPRFEGIEDHKTWYALSAMKILDAQDTLRRYAGPGHWNDPDMLEVGNGLSENENRAHFTMWCMLAAPLIAGNDIRKMSSSTQKILTNQQIIAIDQDSLGIQGLKYSSKDSLETWVKPLINGWAVCFLNRRTVPQPIFYDWKANVINDTLSHRILNASKREYSVYNVWTGKEVGTTKQPVKQIILPHDVVIFRLKE